MFSFLKNHPFAVEAFFVRSLVLTFAAPKEDIQPLIPACLAADTFGDRWAFVAVALVQTTGLRPKGFPRFLGNDFYLVGYRVFVRYTNTAGRRLRGLYILKSETNKRKMEFFGNIFTRYRYSTTDICQTEHDGQTEIRSARSDFRIVINTGASVEDIALPEHSPFADWREARGFAGPMPFTFTYNSARCEVLIIEGVRQNWTPKPVQVMDYHISFLQSLPLTAPVLANAFVVENVPYHWKRGAGSHGTPKKTFPGRLEYRPLQLAFYLLSLGLLLILLVLSRVFAGPYGVCAFAAAVLLMGVTLLSLLVSWYIYDVSALYRMQWCGPCADGACIVNIHAGFDETSALLIGKYPACELIVLDFYDPAKHTEMSIRRARRACPPFPGTRPISTSATGLPDDSADKIFLTLAAHEIRRDEERITFFRALKRALKPTGQIVVAEHLRDLPNFLAYTVGFFHFLPRASWHKTFYGAGLVVAGESKINPFITKFILEKHGTTP